MNVTLTSLEALILKATHESLPQPDAAAMEAFCAVIRDSGEGPQLATQALAARIHSLNAREALLALTMLDRCMRRSDANFHAEVGKFRFLNEMIKLVSPKYFADRTAPEVRTRVLQLLHAWSIEYPKESKFKVAFDMLKNQGVIKETPPPLPPEDSSLNAQPRAKSAVFEDEEKSKLLQKLLQSKKPEDLQHANRLIKTMVREDERRTEANNRCSQEVNGALDSVGLLKDMMEHGEDVSADEEQLIRELHLRCVRIHLVLQRLASADTQFEHLSEILQAMDKLEDGFDKFNIFIDKRRMKSRKTKRDRSSNSDSLLDFAGANADQSENNIPKNGNTAIDELGDIFASDSGSKNIAEPMKPLNRMSTEDVQILGEKGNKAEGWNELDSLGEQLLKQSLPENARRLDSFNSKPTKKIPMNALEKSPAKQNLQEENSTFFDLDFFTKKMEEPVTLSPLPHSSKTNAANDDVMVDISADEISPNINNDYSLKHDSQSDNILDLGLPLENDAKSVKSITENKENITLDLKDRKNKGDLKPLTDINITLQSVHPSKVPPLTAYEEEDGLTVVLHFCKDRPRPDVYVVVVSTTSKNSSPIEDYKFQAVVPKGCKVRLLPASGSCLPAYNPFLPPPALTQLLLLSVPPSPPTLCLKFVLTYTCDGDSCTELGEILDLPLGHI